MSTNFYWINDLGSHDSLHIHIGKQSAAGKYCYDCGTTLHSGGTRMVHSGYGGIDNMFDYWLDNCPSCGGEFRESNDNRNTSPLSPFGIKTGVSACTSFTWTLLKHKWLIEQMAKEGNAEKVIVNEYGDAFTAQEFLAETALCTIEFQLPAQFS